MSNNIENCKTLILENIETFINMIPAHTAEKLARDVAAKRFKAETGLDSDTSILSYNNKFYTYLFPNVALDIFSLPSDNLKRLNNILTQNNLTVSAVKDLQRYRYLFRECYFKHVDGDEFSIHGSYYAAQLLDFISTIATGNFSEQKLQPQDYGFKNSDTAFSFTIENISVKKYKNGRLTIKGLTPTQLRVINLIYNQNKTYTEFLYKTIN